MSSYTRMMEDYDYHKHTGELPEYFGGGSGDNRGCGFAIFVAVILLSGLIYATCSSNKKEENKQQNNEYVTVPTYQYQTPYYPSELSTSATSPTSGQNKAPKVENENNKPEPPRTQTVTKVKISRYYEEGYDKGYDDGEDDAVMDNGWGGQYDDESRYTGKAKKEYELGYEEGYEAGYYDNKDSDE